MKKILIFLAAAIATQASFGVAYCDGHINKLYVDKSGALIIQSSWRNQYSQVCNLYQDWKGVNMQTCFGWLSVLQSAVKNGHSLGVAYLGGADNSYCATIPTYSNSPSPKYIMEQMDLPEDHQ